MAAPEVAGDPGAGWDEAQCASALAQLEQLQTQIDDLRLAIPRIIEPFQQPPSSGMFQQYAQGVRGSQNGIKTLHEQWRSTEITDTFEHTRKSLAANADLSASRSIPRHGWTERERKGRGPHKTSQSESMEESNATLTEDDIAQIITDFQKSHPNIKLEYQDEKHTISTQIISSSVKMQFRVSIEREANGRPKLNVESLGTTEPWISINRCIASRPHPNDLRSLLDMIAAYKNVKGTSCAKCERLLDHLALTPTARRSRQTASASDTTETVWEALHESCLG